jgi:hypothetical protein
MIISDEHRYVFIAQPHTACSAIQTELKRLYGGQRMLTKHATYAAFLRAATPEQKGYFVFSGIRNPLDEVVSLYFKYKTDHKGRYTARKPVLSERQLEVVELITEEQADFASYLRRFYRRPYDNDTIIYHQRMDKVVRFENLQADFSDALRRLGLEQVRPLPVVNPTSERGTYLDYYPEDLRPHAARIFGPFMRKWGYELPAEWVGVTVPRSAFITFRILAPMRYAYRRYLHLGALDVEQRPTNPLLRAVAAATRPIARTMYRLFGH